MSESLTTAQDDKRGGHWLRWAGEWDGYFWFMSFGTFLPLPVFLCGYLAQLTFIGVPLARLLYRFGVFFSTLGQSPPGRTSWKRAGKPRRSGRSPSASATTQGRRPGALVGVTFSSPRKDSPRLSRSALAPIAD